ncbi:MAG TPA: hypothetical protein VMN76_02090 [Acidobacteriota bacterium]|nr:hypothetical protein [Acidobacteriota bacterium]
MRLAISLAALLLAALPAHGNPDLTSLGPEGGDVRSLAVHPKLPDRFFLGTADGQIFVSDNKGLSWRRLVPGIAHRELVIDSLVFHPDDPDTLYAGAWALKGDSGWLFRTRDAGRTWENISLGSYGSTVRAVQVAPSDPRILAVGINEGVLLSRDEGVTWERISRGFRSLHQVHSLAFDPLDREKLYVGTWRLPWKTSDLGEKWEPIHNGMYWDSDIFTLLIHPDRRDTVYASACSGVYRSDDAGRKWSRLRNGFAEEANRARTLRFDPTDPETLYAGTTAGLYVSRDGGASWSLLLKDIVINAIIVDSENPDVILLGTDDAGVLRSTDRGLAFHPSNRGFIQRQVASVRFDPNRSDRVYAAVARDRHYGGFFVSHDGGSTWDSHNEGLGPATAGIRKILPLKDSATVYLGTSAGVFSAIPGQTPWIQAPETKNLAVNDFGILDPEGTSLLIAARQGLFLLQLNPAGLRQLEIPVYNREFFSVQTDPARNLAFVGTDMGVFRSGDGGQSWEIRVNGLPHTMVHALATIGSRLFAGTRSGIYYSDDGAENWRKAPGVLPIEISAIAGGPPGSDLIVAGDFLVGYLFVSRDRGDTWKNFNIRLEASPILTLAASESGSLLAGTLSEGVINIQLPYQAATGAND